MQGEGGEREQGGGVRIRIRDVGWHHTAEGVVPSGGRGAEGVGFEPTVTLPPQWFSRPSPSATRRALLWPPAYGNPERDVSRRGQASPSPTSAARVRYASAVSALSNSRSTSAPSSRCGSYGIRATARQRAAKSCSSRSSSTVLLLLGRMVDSTTTPLRTRSPQLCASSQSRGARALRAPSTEGELTTTIWSASASTPDMAEGSSPLPQSGRQIE